MQNLKIKLTKSRVIVSTLAFGIIIFFSTFSIRAQIDTASLTPHGITNSDLVNNPTQQAVFLRAKEQKLSTGLVKYIATNSEPELMNIESASAQQRTIKDLIIQKCGSIQSGYMEILRVLNDSHDINADYPVGNLGGEVILPGCLFVSKNEGNTPTNYKIKAGDNLSSIYGSFTGDGYNAQAIKDYFSKSDAKLNSISVGEIVNIPYVTATSKITPRIDPDIFMHGISTYSLEINNVEVSPALHYGEVILAMESVGGIASTDNECNGSSSVYPFEPEAVFRAMKYLERTRDSISMGLSESRVAIVDNGFLGVEVDNNGKVLYTPDGKLSLKSPFPEKLFLLNNFVQLGPSTFDNREILPITFLNVAEFDITSISGHGTHVSGLTIGGPLFGSYYTRLFAEDYSYIKLIPISLNRGEQYLAPGSETRLNNSLMTGISEEVTPTVVNLSIAYNPEQDHRVLTRVIRNLDLVVDSDRYANTLFVAAAGNDRRNITSEEIETYPAKLGGEMRENVITVASHDANNKISNFSNYGTRHVDIAAPGCKISSWLDLSTVSKLSGTSQAAPLVTFTAALLRTFWNSSSIRLKNRIIYSGDLIGDSVDRNKIRSKSILNIPKSLYMNHDYLEIKKGNDTGRYLGKVSSVSQLQCNFKEGSESKSWRNVYSIKKDSSGNTFLYYGNRNARNIDICAGEIKNITEEGYDNTFVFLPMFEINGTHIIPNEKEGPQSITIRTRDLIEIVKSEQYY